MKPQAHALPPDVQHAAFERDLAINEVVRVNKAQEALLAECKRQREQIKAFRALADHVMAMATDVHFSDHPEWAHIVGDACAAIKEPAK